jgi:tol-pal system protein YbgF
MKIYPIAACAALSLALVSGCTATAGSSSLQRDVEALKVEVADLKDDSRLADMRGGSADPAELSRLRGQVQQLSANVDSGDMSGLSMKQQLDAISARLERLERQAGLQPPAPVMTPAPAASNSYGGPSSTYRGPDEPAPVAAAAPAAPANLYEEGKALFDRKQYREAAVRFKSYLVSEPKGAEAAAAQFYIGESLYNQKQYEEAILEYQNVMNDYPKSAQIPTSLLKQGLSFQAIGQGDSAKLLFQKIVRDHSKSYAAGIAKERLKTL